MKIDSELEKIIEDYFDEFYYRFSSLSTEKGIHRYDYKLSNIRKADLIQWFDKIKEYRDEISALKKKKNLERSIDMQLFEKMLSNESNWLSRGYELGKNPLFFTSSISKALTSVAFGAYAPISIRSRSFTSRLSDVKNIKKALEENVIETNNFEKEAAIDELFFLRNFIEVFSSYLLSKSDIEKKDDVRTQKTDSLGNLVEMVDIISRSNLDNSFTLDHTLKRFYYEDILLRDLNKPLSESLFTIRDSLIKKAREISITSSHQETLSRILNEKDFIDEEKIRNIYDKVKSISSERFLETSAILDIKKVPQELEKNATFLSNFDSLKVLPMGEFDAKQNVTVVLTSEENMNLLLFNLLTFGIPGSGLLRQIRSEHVKSPRNYYSNILLEKGWGIYARREIADEIRQAFGSECELVFLYKEYLTTLKAFIQNEILMNRADAASIKEKTYQDELVLDKENFTKILFIEQGESLLGIHGLYNIIELRRQFGGRMKLSDFYFRLLSNSNLPFKFIRQVL